MNRMARSLSVALCVVVLNVVHGPACVAKSPDRAQLPTSTPVAEGMSAEKLAKVGEIMNGLIEDKKIAGGLVLIARNGSTLR